MCSRCGFPALRSRAGASSAFTADEAAKARVRLLQAILQPHGVKVELSALAAALRLTALDGETVLTSGTDDLWPLVERLLGAPLDPLAPCYTAMESQRL